MGIEILYSKFCVAENVDITYSCLSGELVIIIVLGNIVDLKLKHCLCFGMVGLGISKGYNIILDAHLWSPQWGSHRY